MSALERSAELDPGYARELLSTIRELVDAAIAVRTIVVFHVERYGVSTTPPAMRARRLLEELDGAIAEGQARL